MARGLAAVIRRLAIAAVFVAVLLAAYFLLARDSTVAPTVTSSQATAVIGSGSSAVGVAADGAILSWLPAPDDGSLPRLPLSEPPKNG
ncbi:MAG TPA: hypothetical protein VII45_07480, partial [Solirubrobacterales bacterium]